MPQTKNAPIADIDEDPNIEVRPYRSPPCYAQEVDPAYFGIRRPDLAGLHLLERRLGEAQDMLDHALRTLAR